MRAKASDASVKKLERLSAMVGEHFPDYLLVVSDGERVFNQYNSRTSAYGMASMIQLDIEEDWRDQTIETQHDEEENQ